MLLRVEHMSCRLLCRACPCSLVMTVETNTFIQLDIGCLRRHIVIHAVDSGNLLHCVVQATFYALQATYGFLTPELWKETRFSKSPMQEFTDFLAKPALGDVRPTPEY